MSLHLASGTAAVGRDWDKQRVVKAVLLVIVCILVFGPLIVLLLTSLLPSGMVPLTTTQLTFDNFRTLFNSGGIPQLLLNTAIYASGSVFIGVLLGGAIAWLTERTDMPGRVFIRILMFCWMAVPSMVIAYGWVLLINPSSGAINILLKWVFGPGMPTMTPYCMTAMILVTGLATAPTAFVMLAGLLRNMDSKLEEAAYVLGSSWLTIIRRVTIPLLMPGLLSAVIFLIMGVIQAFDLPLILGMTARIPVLSTRIYALASSDSGVSDYGLSAALGTILLVLAGALMWGYFRMTRATERFRTITGKAFRPRILPLGYARAPAVIVTTLLFVLMFLPILILLWTSLQPYYRLPSLTAARDISLDAYTRVLQDPILNRALWNTLKLFLSAATITMVLSCLVSWFSVRSKGRTGKWLDVLSFSPMAIPPVVMALAILVLYLRTPLYGSLLVLIIGHVTIYLAFGARAMIGTLIQVDVELENAAAASGATWWTTLRRITGPLLFPQIVNSWLWIATHSARDLTFPLLLMTTSNLVAASSIWMVWNYPDLSGASAISMLLLLGLTVMVVPVQILAARRMDRAQ